MNWLTPAHRKWFLLAIKLLIVATIAWFIRGTVVAAWAQVRSYPREFAPAWLVVSGALYLLGMLPEGLFWHRALKALGQEAGLGETLRAYFIGHLGKYVPGKAMVIVLRTGLIHSHRIDTGLAVASVFLETLTMMAVGACIAVPILAIYFSHDPRFLVAAIGVAAVAGLPTLPPVFSRLARILGVGRANPAAAEKLAGLSYSLLLGGWIGMTCGWVLVGASLWAVLRAMGIPAELTGQIHLYTATVALAVVVGFVSMIPGGLLARDVALATLLGSIVADSATALIAAALLRLAWLVAEVVISAILYAAGKLVRH